MPEQLTSKAGEIFFVVTTAELEAANGWRYTHGGRKGRGACVMHGGDNKTAMEADFDTGDVTCHTRGCYGRIAEHADTKAGKGNGPRLILGGHRRAPGRPAASPAPRPTPTQAPPDARDMAALRDELTTYAAALAGSRGEQYLRERGFELDVATACGIGWGGASGRMAGRVVFPLTDRNGNTTSATGRDTTGKDDPRYYTLPSSKYPKTWFNGRAIADAVARGLPVYLCEGPLDALALVAGGITTAVAVLGTSGVRVEWLAGLRRVVVCFDDDDAGRKGKTELAFDAAALGVAVELMPPAILGDCNDLADFWKAHRRLPDDLLAHWQAAQAAPAQPEPSPDVEPAEAVEPPAQPAAAGRVLIATDDDLLDDDGAWRDDDLPPPGITAAAWAKVDGSYRFELRDGLFISPRADALCPADYRLQAAVAALWAARRGIVDYAHLAEDVKAANPVGDEQAFWRAVMMESHERRRRQRPEYPRCRACGAEVIADTPCRICRGWKRPESVVGLGMADLLDALAAHVTEMPPGANAGPWRGERREDDAG